MEDIQRKEYKQKCERWRRGNRCLQYDFFEGRVRHRKTEKCDEDCCYMRDYDKKHNLFDVTQLKVTSKSEEPQMNFINFVNKNKKDGDAES